MKGAALITTLKRKFRVTTDAAVAKHLGISLPAVQLWKKRRSVSIRQIASLVHKASFQSNVIRPVVEFFPVAKVKSAQGKSWELFSAEDDDGYDHPYRSGLEDELSKYHGVYIFFDSRGQVIYAGKARRQTLWREINLAFNRKRGDVQSIMRANHPKTRKKFRTAPRQIVSQPVALHELAAYFSAYHVPDTMINDLEAMLVRSFANDLLNIKMEYFGA
jgi:hypothetical protein